MGLVLQNGTSLETIRIHKSELAKIVFKEGDKELSIKGEMYDVKTTSTEGEYIVFHCLKDKKETKLLAELDKEVKYNSSSVPASEKRHNDISKNPIQDLFFSEKIISITSFVIVAWPSAVRHLTSYIAPTLPLPPPEIFVA